MRCPGEIGGEPRQEARRARRPGSAARRREGCAGACRVIARSGCSRAAAGLHHRPCEALRRLGGSDRPGHDVDVLLFSSSRTGALDASQSRGAHRKSRRSSCPPRACRDGTRATAGASIPLLEAWRRCKCNSRLGLRAAREALTAATCGPTSSTRCSPKWRRCRASARRSPRR